MACQIPPLHPGEKIAPTSAPARVARLVQSLKVTKGNRNIVLQGEVCYLRGRFGIALCQQPSLRAKRGNPVQSSLLDCFALLAMTANSDQPRVIMPQRPSRLRVFARTNQTLPRMVRAGGKAHPLPLPQAGGEIITLPQPRFHQRRQIGLWPWAEV